MRPYLYAIAGNEPAFQSTHSLRSATPVDTNRLHSVPVSIHALLAECDPRTIKERKIKQCFNPRTPCGVRRVRPYNNKPTIGFNPRTPCGVRPGHSSALPARTVSIHALLAECDVYPMGYYTRLKSFNPRTPCGVRRILARNAGRRKWFQSTHSLRSATGPGYVIIVDAGGFNPRTPCGVRRVIADCTLAAVQFQSTHSLRSATDVADIYTYLQTVSIHALLAECDCAQPYTLLLNKANHTLRQPP